jgi:hypothetical protein
VRNRAGKTAILAALAVGITVGWELSGRTPAFSSSQSSAGVGESKIIAGSIAIQPNPSLKTNDYQDAVYYLDYRAGRLIVTIPPSLQSTTARRSMLDRLSLSKQENNNNGSKDPSFLDNRVERDLVKDFQIAPGSSANFLMAVGQAGDVWSRLYVVETVSRKVATYRAEVRKVANASHPRFDLLDIRGFGDEHTPPLGKTSVTTGPIAMMLNHVLDAAVNQDAVYILDETNGRLWVSAPAMIQGGAGPTKTIENFVEYDLRKDFKMSANVPARFVMTIGRVGMVNAPIYVFEEISRRVGVYRISPSMKGVQVRLWIQLMEFKSIAPEK